VRDIQFTEPIQCSILSERRVFRPFGLDGGGDAQCGQNVWMKLPREEDGDLAEGRDGKEYRAINLGGKTTVKMGSNDRIIVRTPGGGAYGKVEDRDKSPLKEVRARQSALHKGSHRGSVADRKGLAEGV
jgi:5-oxoprolinase (ATP-hydrolysing)